MGLNSIRLQNFRSYNDETFEFSKGVNIIVGPNTSGKTNLLEAIQLTCLGKSHRGQWRETIMHAKNWARVDIDEVSTKRTLKIEQITEEKANKSWEINAQKLKRLSLNKTIPMVLFEPNQLRLLDGQPQRRREYIDDLLQQQLPDYKTTRSKYNRALYQRNNLLKKGRDEARQQIFGWDVRLSELGGQIAKARQKLIKDINNQITELYQKLSHSKDKLTVEYANNFPVNNYESKFLKYLQENLDKDINTGFTTRGPHREDLHFYLGDKPVSEVASRGEARTILLTLKITEVGLLEKTRKQKPIILLDDVFSELDGSRRLALTKFLKNYQTFITTTDADIVVQHFMNNCHIIPLSKN